MTSSREKTASSLAASVISSSAALDGSSTALRYFVISTFFMNRTPEELAQQSNAVICNSMRMLFNQEPNPFSEPNAYYLKYCVPTCMLEYCTRGLAFVVCQVRFAFCTMVITLGCLSTRRGAQTAMMHREKMRR